MAQRNTVQIIINAKDDASSILAGVGGALEGVGKFALGAVAAVGAAAVGIGAAITKLAIDAAPLQGVQAAFEGLANSADIGADEMLSALERGSAGMISQRELMTSFNKAAQLVSVDFASVLPDAMGALGKVAAATGEDMGFLLDSLVVGVGRLSPMILDNLGIQVSLTEANQAYAESIGVAVGDLTKEQQQIALTNQVLEKLADNTANMPDVTDSASAGLAQMGATFKNIKDQVGLAAIPALQAIVKPILAIATNAGPKLIAWAQEIGKWLGENIPVAIEALASLFEGDFQGAIDLVRGIIENTFGDEGVMIFDEWVDRIQTGIQVVVDFFDNTVLPAFETVKAWFVENWPIIQETAITALQNVWAFLQDNIIPILAGVGAAILLVVVPAFIIWADAAIVAAIGTIAALAPVVLPIIAIGAAVALLVAAWQKDWGGIRTFLTDVWENKLRPIFITMQEWLQENLPIAIEVLREIWEEVLLPALTIVWEFIQDSIIPILEAVAEVADAVLGLALRILTGIWENQLKPALKTVWEFLKDKILPIFGEVSDFVEDTLGPILKWFNETILTPLKDAFEFMADAAEAFVEWLKLVKEALDDIEVPWWARNDSPPPLAVSFTDMGDAIKALATIELPRLAMEFNAMASIGDNGRATSGDNIVNNFFNQTINAQDSDVALESLNSFQDMRAMVRA